MERKQGARRHLCRARNATSAARDPSTSKQPAPMMAVPASVSNPPNAKRPMGHPREPSANKARSGRRISMSRTYPATAHLTSPHGGLLLMDEKAMSSAALRGHSRMDPFPDDLRRDVER